MTTAPVSAAVSQQATVDAALLLELSGSCALLQDPERPTYVALGSRIEQLLKNAEDQSVALIEAARAEAARIVSEAEADRFAN
jgi:cell division septum initiation protein DivIVA